MIVFGVTLHRVQVVCYLPVRFAGVAEVGPNALLLFIWQALGYGIEVAGSASSMWLSAASHAVRWGCSSTRRIVRLLSRGS
jgi:hypothetical protein